MSRMDSPRRLSEDARFELAMNAAGHARRNRPTGLILGAGAAFVVSLVAAAWGLSSRLSAREAFRRQQANRETVDQLSGEWAKLDEAGKQGTSAESMRPFPNLVSTVETCARNAGLKTTPQPPHLTTTQLVGATDNKYTYNDVRDPSLPGLLEWIRQSASQVPGMEVYDLTLKPGATDWSINVTFRRVERAGS